jgi:hypothetical protein
MVTIGVASHISLHKISAKAASLNDFSLPSHPQKTPYLAQTQPQAFPSTTMSPCIGSHCPSTEKYCQRSSCTLELRNRLERRRVERDQLHAKLKAETLSSMRALFDLLEACDNEVERFSIMQVKSNLEKQSAKPLGRPKCYSAQCAVVYKDREISALRKNFQALQVVKRFVEDRQRACRSQSKSKPKVVSV